ncbi:MAG: LysR family transcriptional regulator [Lachnospiraceae bacterium]|nr:LysR family transcriptional regulator [Lachnospiraceae bacterium]
MKALTRLLFVNDRNEKFFGEGPYRLLRGVERSGSLRATALEMGMSYTKALKLITNAEKELGFKFTTRVVGGKSGGGSCLTDEGRAWLDKYEQYRDSCLKETERIYHEYYGE